MRVLYLTRLAKEGGGGGGGGGSDSWSFRPVSGLSNMDVLILNLVFFSFRFSLNVRFLAWMAPAGFCPNRVTPKILWPTSKNIWPKTKSRRIFLR